MIANGRYSESEQGNALVIDHLRQIAEGVSALVDSRALVLLGSYGRGEGVVRQADTGELVPVNDYDIAVITEGKPGFITRRRLKHLRHRLAQELNIWHVDLILIDEKDLRQQPVRMLYYDMKFGSQVFGGDCSVLNDIPYSSGAAIPEIEIVNLLANRMVTLLEGHVDVGSEHSAADKARQLAKVLYALMDSHLVDNGCYVTRYGEKRERIHELAISNGGGNDFLVQHLDWVGRAWVYQLDAEELGRERLLTLWSQVRQSLCAEIVRHTAVLNEMNVEQLSEEGVLLNWRGKRTGAGFFRRMLCVLQGRAEKRFVEQQIFALLCSYSEKRRWNSVKRSFPVFSDATAAGGASWSSCAGSLVSAWYRSV